MTFEDISAVSTHVNKFLGVTSCILLDDDESLEGLQPLKAQ